MIVVLACHSRPDGRLFETIVLLTCNAQKALDTALRAEEMGYSFSEARGDYITISELVADHPYHNDHRFAGGPSGDCGVICTLTIKNGVWVEDWGKYNKKGFLGIKDKKEQAAA